MHWLDLVRPAITWRMAGRLALVSLAGSALAGLYGILHDQLTYTISREYFTRFKFFQFHYAAPANGNERLFAGTIGFLATWWVGALVAWVIGRVQIWRKGELPSRQRLASSFAIVWAGSALGACTGWLWSLHRRRTGFDRGWIDWTEEIGVQDAGAFLTVGFIHNGSYLGGVFGTFAALVWLWWLRRCDPRLQSASEPPE